MAVPLRITGPAVVVFNGQTYYFQDGLKGSIKGNTDKIVVDGFGAIGEFHTNFAIEYSGKAAGVIDTTYIASLFPDVRNLVGKSIYTSTDIPLTIWTLHPFDVSDLNKIVFARGAIKKTPEMLFSATKGPIFNGDVTFGVLMKSDFNMIAADAWYTASNATYTGTSLNLNLIRYARYSAALGSRSTPYNDMISQEGFTFQNEWTTKDISVDNFGIIDQEYSAESFRASCKFKPANLTKAQVDGLIRLQGSTALLPGDLLGGGAEDLVLTSDKLIATLKNCAASDSGDVFKTGVLQRDEVMFLNAANFVSGIADPAFAFSIPM
jgi:hypothetical protein